MRIPPRNSKDWLTQKGKELNEARRMTAEALANNDRTRFERCLHRLKYGQGPDMSHWDDQTLSWEVIRCAGRGYAKAADRILTYIDRVVPVSDPAHFEAHWAVIRAFGKQPKLPPSAPPATTTETASETTTRELEGRHRFPGLRWAYTGLLLSLILALIGHLGGVV